MSAPLVRDTTALTGPRNVGKGRRSITRPGLLLGLGLGGLADGILLRQVLQWHHLSSGDGTLGGRSTRTVAGLEANTLADGLFHVATWGLTVVGLLWLWGRSSGSARAARGPGGSSSGCSSPVGGVFDVVEGLVDHQILGVHHVRDDIVAPLAWDLGFLAFGAVLAVVGTLLARAAGRAEQR